MRYTNPSPPRSKLLLSVHVATAVSVLGTDLVLLVLGISSVRGADPRTIYPAADLIATWLLAPLAVVALGTGVLLGLLTQWGLLETAAGKVEFDLTEGEGPVVLASHGGLGGVPPPPVRGVSGWQSQYRTRELSVRWKQLIRKKDARDVRTRNDSFRREAGSGGPERG